MLKRERNLIECGDSQELKDLICNLEHLMYGHNYTANLGLTLLSKCIDLEMCKSEIQSIFKDSDPDEYRIVSVKENEFWENIRYGFSYRGDEGAGLKLSGEDERKLNDFSNEYIDYLRKLILNDADFYFYPSEKGIPVYPIFWDYRFIVVNKNGMSLFVFGSSSD